MEANQVIDKILSEARGEAEKVAAEEQTKQTEKQAKLNEQLAAYKEQTAHLAEEAAEDKKARMLATARMDIAKQNLAFKRDILDDVFAKAKQQIQQLSDGDYRELVKKLMLAAVETGDEEVIIDNKEKAINHDFIKKINHQLGPGFKGNLRLSEERQPIGAGFILKRGKIKKDASLAVLLAEARKQLEIELAKQLFAQ